MNFKGVKTPLSLIVVVGWFLMPLIMVKMPGQDKIDQVIITDLDIKTYAQSSFMFTPKQIAFWLLILTTIFLSSWTIYDYYKRKRIGVAQIIFFIFSLIALCLTIYGIIISN